jgi:indoleamine 2,3-dioxygenase
MTLSLARGFLPQNDPLQLLPAAFSAWENLAQDLPKLLVSNQFKNILKNMPPFPSQQLGTPPEYERAMLILSFLGQAYVWGEKQPEKVIPAILALPWCEVAKKLGRPPILSYASYALHNWRRITPKLPIELGNIALLQNFLGGIDEEWFVLVHIDIEAKAAQALAALFPGLEAAATKDTHGLVRYLNLIAESLLAICNVLDRMPEHCDPYIYYHRVRPYIHGWKNHPALPEGVAYENCFDNKPQYFRGETGAQSSIIPALDAFFGIAHHPDELSIYLKEMRGYMPTEHRAFLEAIESNSLIRTSVLEHAPDLPALRDSYNHCIDLITRFRITHLKYAAQYIQKQSQQVAGNPNAVGTGGTPFMDYLLKHQKESESFKI